ncbi:hypothetical protein WA026_017240 [Henosepilachna vigintioctopunctata]|uniref:Uncharacterized protein n=1 Tax=Henosepilachna vigintioctopunctata TaxID=420089 RepID=A0AAW1ULQ6_9CUCU
MRLDLEDISLQLLNSMNEVKKEMDSLSKDMNDVEDLDNLITSSLGFNYDDENEDIIEDLKIILEELNYVITESEKQNIMLKENLKNIRIMKEHSKCSKCYNNHEDVITSSPIINSIQLDGKLTTNVVDNHTNYKIGKLCPVCSRQSTQLKQWLLTVIQELEK